MSEQDVKEQLGQYGDWLQQAHGLDLAPSDAGLAPSGLDLAPSGLDLAPSGDVELLIEPAAPPSRNRSHQIVLVAAVLVILAGAAIVLRSAPSELQVASAPHDPVGPLYVLPEPLPSEPMLSETLPSPLLHNAQVTEDGEPVLNAGSEFLIVGTPSGAGAFTDLARIQIGKPPDQFPGELTPLDLASGPAQVFENSFITFVIQDRAGTTIVVRTQGDRVEYASTILDSVTIDSAGSATVETNGAIEVISTVKIQDGALPGSTFTSFDLASEMTTDGGSLAIETATSPSPLLGVGGLGSRVSATGVRGVEAWAITRPSADGEWHGITWQATPNRMIAVSGHASLDVIQAVAESLVIVSEDDWKAALPDYTTG